MKNEILFSIVIPIYNVEDYLEQCLDSILCQTFNNFEMILINDGSLDRSLEICLAYQKKNDRLFVIDKKNGGTSEARNLGLLKAKGDYVIFTDSDDYWNGKEVLKEIADLISKENPDVILHEEIRYFSKKNIKHKNNRQFFDEKKGDFKKDANKLVYYDLYAASPWDKIVKRKILIENNVFFPLDRYLEDMEWTGELMDYLHTYSIYEKSFYIYRQRRPGSVTSSLSKRQATDIYKMVKKGLNKVELNQKNTFTAKQNYWICNYVVVLMILYLIPSKSRKIIWKDLYQWKYLLKKGINIKVDKTMFFYQFLPFKMLPFFLNTFRIFNTIYKRLKTLNYKMI